MAANAAFLDLTPLPHKRQLEGGSEDDIAFHYGTSLVTYSPPFGWAATGDERHAVFRPDANQAEAQIEVRRLPDTTAFDPVSVKALKTELEQSLPREVQKVEWADDEASPVLMNRHPTYRITVSYSAFGQRYKTTLVVCNFQREQVRFKLTTREADFDSLYEPFRRSLFTFVGLD